MAENAAYLSILEIKVGEFILNKIFIIDIC